MNTPKKRSSRPEWAKKPKTPISPYIYAWLNTAGTLILFFTLYIYAALAAQHAPALLSKARFLQELLPSLTFVGLIASWVAAAAKSKATRTAFLILGLVPWLYGIGMFLVLR